MALAEFPQPRDDDPEDVHWALTTAASLQARGDMADALRWLRKAVAAAMATECDGRAIQLGRCAADLEELLTSAPTGRGDELDGATTDLDGATTDPDGVPSALSRLVSGELDVHGVARDPLAAGADDDLDPPTHVDFRRHHHEEPLSQQPPTTSPPVDSHSAPTARAGQPGETDDDHTLVPFTKVVPSTQKAAGMPSAEGAGGVPSTEGAGGVRRVAPPAPAGAAQVAAARSAGARTLGSSASTDDVELDDELTLAVRIAPNTDELGSGARGRRDLDSRDKTLPAMTSLVRFRVALVASADGGSPRIIQLSGGEDAPAGSGVAMLIPSSSQDAERISSLLADRGDDS